MKACIVCAVDEELLSLYPRREGLVRYEVLENSASEIKARQLPNGNMEITVHYVDSNDTRTLVTNGDIVFLSSLSFSHYTNAFLNGVEIDLPIFFRNKSEFDTGFDENRYIITRLYHGFQDSASCRFSPTKGNVNNQYLSYALSHTPDDIFHYKPQFPKVFVVSGLSDDFIFENNHQYDSNYDLLYLRIPEGTEYISIKQINGDDLSKHGIVNDPPPPISEAKVVYNKVGFHIFGDHEYPIKSHYEDYIVASHLILMTSEKSFKMRNTDELEGFTKTVSRDYATRMIRVEITKHYFDGGSKPLDKEEIGVELNDKEIDEWYVERVISSCYISKNKKRHDDSIDSYIIGVKAIDYYRDLIEQGTNVPSVSDKES